MSEKRRLKAGVEFEPGPGAIAGINIGGELIGSILSSHLDAISEPVEPQGHKAFVLAPPDTGESRAVWFNGVRYLPVPEQPVPSARERVAEKLRLVISGYFTHADAGREADAILADLGLDEHGKRAMPDEAELEQLQQIFYERRLDDSGGMPAVLLATGHYAEPKP